VIVCVVGVDMSYLLGMLSRGCADVPRLSKVKRDVI
jgi:hypothetical protein